MKRVVKTAMLMLFCAPLMVAQNSTGQFYMAKKARWEHPKGAPVGLKVASTTVLYVSNDHVFVRDDCWLNKVDNKITISNGDPHNEYAGSWEPILDGLKFRYRLVRRTIEHTGEVLPGPDVTGDAGVGLRMDAGLTIGRELYLPFQPANGHEYEHYYRELAETNASSNAN